MVKRKTKKIKGGRFIAAGSSGCVFGNPPLKCDDEPSRRSDRFVSKLTTQQDIDNSIDVFTGLYNLDSTNEYFIVPTSSCYLDQASIQPNDDIDKCVNYKAYESLLFMESAGVNLDNLAIPYSEYIPFFNSLPKLLEGIRLLHSNRYTHFDIKPTNITTQRNIDTTFTTRLIDFDLVSVNNKIEKPNLPVLENMYVYWPIELKYYHKFLQPQIQNQPLFPDSFVENILDKWYTNQASYKPQLLQGDNYFTKTGPKYDKHSNEIAHLSTIDYSTYSLSKVDIFSLGRTLGDLYYTLIGHYMGIDVNNIPILKVTKLAKPITQETRDWYTAVITNISEPFLYLIKDMHTINPDKRPSIETILVEYNKLLPHMHELFTAEKLSLFLEPNTSPQTPFGYQPPPPPPAPPPAPSNRRTSGKSHTMKTRGNRSRSRNRTNKNKPIV